LPVVVAVVASGLATTRRLRHLLTPEIGELKNNNE
jgi:hypothetical protein